jgi:hypothetical protein
MRNRQQPGNRYYHELATGIVPVQAPDGAAEDGDSRVLPRIRPEVFSTI